MKRLLLAAVAAAAAAEAQAGPWAQGRGRSYTKASVQHLRAREYAQPDGTVFPIPRFRTTEMAAFGAYGLTERLTLWVNVPAVRSSNLADEPDELGRETGFGDVGAALQVQLGARGPWVFAVRGGVQAPTGDEMRSEGLQATGSGVVEATAVLGAGRSLAGGRGFAFAEAGYRQRGGGLRDAFVYAGQVGWNAARRLILAWNLRGEEPFSHEPGTARAGSFVGLGDRVTYLVYGPSAIVGLGGGWGLQLDLEGAARARNLVKGPLLRAGITYQR